MSSVQIGATPQTALATVLSALPGIAPAPPAPAASAGATPGSETRSAPPLSGVLTPGISGATLLAVQEAGSGETTDARGLTPEEQEQVTELKKVDAEVRRHEQAHKAAGGQYAGAPQFEFVRGPDGQLYAVSGEVAIDTGEENSPEATIAKMEVVIKAALAPAQPSAQDHKVAQQARQKINEARAELARDKREQEAEAAQKRLDELGGEIAGRATRAYARAVETVTQAIQPSAFQFSA